MEKDVRFFNYSRCSFLEYEKGRIGIEVYYFKQLVFRKKINLIYIFFMEFFDCILEFFFFYSLC